MSTRSAVSTDPTRRRRPADRRQHIIVAAARAFSDAGYHAARLDEIADAAGVSTPALYRHFPNKYALFVEATSWLADSLTEAISGVAPNPADPRAELDALLGAIAATAIDNRRTGGLYRWEFRYLTGCDADRVRDVAVTTHRRLRTVIRAARPELTRTDADLIAAAMTAVVASPATHRAALPAREIRSLMQSAATALLDVTSLGSAPDLAADTAVGLSPTAKRETILTESIALFAIHGFHDVTIEQIGRAAGVPASGVYRHFPSKAAILEAAFWRASDRMSASITAALAAATTPREAITELVVNYVELSWRNRALISVYTAEIGHLDAGARTALRNQQRINVEEWATWVTRERPDVTPTAARFLVHAALAVINDLMRSPVSVPQHCIETLGRVTLLGA